MNRRATSIAVAAALLVATITTRPQAALQQTSPTSAEPAGSEIRVSGVVVTTDANGSPQPVSRASVTLSGAGTSRVGVTDDEGRFVFGGIAAGTYSVTATKAGYLAGAYGALGPEGPGTPLVVRSGQSAAGLSIDLARGAVIAGTVVRSDSTPAPNLVVRVYRAGAATLRPAPVEQSMTDDRGTYRIFGLPPGAYTVEASPGVPTSAGMRVMSAREVDAELADLERQYGRGRAALPPPSPTRGRGASTSTPAADLYTYAPVFYPSTTEPAQAVPIVVSVGGERTGVDFSLVLAGTTYISGSVVGADGAPRAGVAVVAFHSGSDTASLGFRPTTVSAQADGTFRIVNVTPGRYTVQARTIVRPTPATPMSVDEWASEDVEVSGAAVTGLILRFEPALKISGRVVFDRSVLNAPSELAAVRVSLALSATRPQGLGAVAPAAAVIGAEGRFEISGVVPGVYDVTVSVPPAPAPGWRLRSIMLGGRDLADEPWTMDANSRLTDGMVVTFTDRRTSVSGALENLAGRPAPEYVVVAFPTDRRLWTSPRRVAMTRPDSDGRFAVRDLPAGEYRLAVLTNVLPRAAERPALFESLGAGGVLVNLSEDTPTIQNLRVGRE